MIIENLLEGQKITLANNDLVINCDVPKNVCLDIADGNVIIHGSVGENVKITVVRIPLVNFKHNSSYLLADCAWINEKGSAVLGGGMIMSGNVKLFPDNKPIVLVDGKEFKVTFYSAPINPRHNLHITGTISETTNIISTGGVYVSSQKMICENPEFSDIHSARMIVDNLIAKEGHDNIAYFKKLIALMGNKNNSIIFNPVYTAAKSGKTRYLELLIQNKFNLNSGIFESPLLAALTRGHFEAAKLLIEAGCDYEPKTAYKAAHTNCKKDFLAFMQEKNISITFEKKEHAFDGRKYMISAENAEKFAKLWGKKFKNHASFSPFPSPDVNPELSPEIEQFEFMHECALEEAIGKYWLLKDGGKTGRSKR